MTRIEAGDAKSRDTWKTGSGGLPWSNEWCRRAGVSLLDCDSPKGIHNEHQTDVQIPLQNTPRVGFGLEYDDGVLGR